MHESVIGLEIHVQLATRTKMFCGDPAVFGAPPNTNVCPVCLGLPGALPVANGRAVELAVRAALALGCQVHETSVFARKHYFYPDLPKGYQITQFERPLATGGALEIEQDDVARTVRLRRIHLEEDAGKSLHDRVAGATAVDLNRAGVPLIEIVTEPDLRGPGEARAFLVALKRILEYAEVSDCDMEKGSLRVDANVSIRPAGAPELGTKTELKNMNSFGNVERALAFEIDRQEEAVRAGRSVVHETLLWDEAAAVARPMRSKEESHDYRYFPDPDLPPLALGPGLVERVAAGLPERPDARARRLRETHALPAYDADVLTATRATADFYEAVVAAGAEAKAASNWVMTEVLAWSNATGRPPADLPFTPARLAELLALIESGRISNAIAKRVFERMAETGDAPDAIVEREGLAQIGDEDRIRAWAREIVGAHAAEASRYRAGEEKLMGFFMGQLMKRSRGKADPVKATEALRAELGSPDV